MSKKIAYCSLEPKFPKKAYMLFLFILHHDQMVGMIPLDAIYTTRKEASLAVKDLLKQFDTAGQEVTVPEECILIPLTWHAAFPLQEEFWQDPTFSYDYHMRAKTFTPFFDHPQLYSLLVTPYSFDNKTRTWYLSAALPLMKPNDTDTIKQFMYLTDYVVEPRAKSAGIYTVGKKKRFNWQTQMTKPFIKLAANINPEID